MGSWGERDRGLLIYTVKWQRCSINCLLTQLIPAYWLSLTWVLLDRNGPFKAKKKGDMATRVSNFSDLIQRVTASCLLHPLANVRQDSQNVAVEEYGEQNDDDCNDSSEEDDEEEETKGRGIDNSSKVVSIERVMELETVMNEVFDAVSAMKRAYVSLQEAHCPWDPERMRVADVAVVGELRKIGVLRERLKRRSFGGGRRCGDVSGGALVREVAAPYEAAVAELKRELKAREVEVDNLKEKLKTVTGLNNNGGKKGRSLSKRKVNCSSQGTKPCHLPTYIINIEMNKYVHNLKNECRNLT